MPHRHVQAVVVPRERQREGQVRMGQRKRRRVQPGPVFSVQHEVDVRHLWID